MSNAHTTHTAAMALHAFRGNANIKRTITACVRRVTSANQIVANGTTAVTSVASLQWAGLIDHVVRLVPIANPKAV